MELALTDLYRAKWSAMIHDEWMRSVLKNRPDLSEKDIERTRTLMDMHVLDCLVEGFEPLIEAVELPDPDDRHVLTGAIRAGADLIVTYNLKDFPDELLMPYGVEAQHSDQFLDHLLDLAPGVVCSAVRTHRHRLRNPAKSVDKYLDTLERQALSGFVAALREFADLI